MEDEMKARHTPGIWTYQNGGTYITYRTEDGADLVVARVDYGMMPEEYSANARLIAAAPDLLDVCRQLVWAYENGDELELGNAVSSARAAIAKVEGDE
jgi:hypothetical protein